MAPALVIGRFADPDNQLVRATGSIWEDVFIIKLSIGGMVFSVVRAEHWLIL
jgi:hypothetical protein